jgi:hypothetical protein
LGYLRKVGIVDAIGAGGSEGSLAIGYLDKVPFPIFPDKRVRAIARLYHNPAPPPAQTISLDNFVEWHRRWNEQLGLWELDREMKRLQLSLAKAQEEVIQGVPVEFSELLTTPRVQ